MEGTKLVLTGRTYGVWDTFRIPFRCAPILTVLAILQTLLAGAAPTMQIVATASFIDNALSIVQNESDLSLIYPSMLAVVALIAYQWMARQWTALIQVRLELSIREQFRTAITEKRAKLAYRHIENHETWDLISRIAAAPETKIRSAFTDLLAIVSKAIQVTGILILLITQVWWAALLILALTAPLFALAIKSGRSTYEAGREVSKYKRKYEYLTEVLTGREAVDERTLFGFGGPVGERWYRHYETARSIEFRTERKWFIKMKAGSVLTAIVSMLIIMVLIGPVIAGAVTIGMFISLVNAVFGIVQMMSWQFTANVDQLTKHREYLKDLTEFARLEETDGAAAAPVFPAPVFESLEFREVKFVYPGMQAPVLNGLSFRIQAGSQYAFVGVNGAGKTTIMKLLTGLYDQYDGEILLNGKPISEYGQHELKAFYSVVYQDFAKYYIPLKDNIAVGDVNRLRHDAEEGTLARIRQAAGQVSLHTLEQKLPEGFDTPLGKIKTGGQDVSGGEWQRIAMARALLNPAPVRILDEPTAALDPIGESKLYEQFEQISRDKTTLFISHRLGSTLLADHIFVIGDGRIIEQGSHPELMKARGVYAGMYESQRSWYQ
ncbi:ABC transporter ATP-binding protein [Paenibacillus sp. GCM10012303]|uniref:ABC transporter ATP-binding protein n=1 Tax=Paenibacillus sp. GCM10012303 TaxID=3317340 RepID=UPI00361187A2